MFSSFYASLSFACSLLITVLYLQPTGILRREKPGKLHGWGAAASRLLSVQILRDLEEWHTLSLHLTWVCVCCWLTLRLFCTKQLFGPCWSVSHNENSQRVQELLGTRQWWDCCGSGCSWIMFFGDDSEKKSQLDTIEDRAVDAATAWLVYIGNWLIFFLFLETKTGTKRKLPSTCILMERSFTFQMFFRKF